MIGRKVFWKWLLSIIIFVINITKIACIIPQSGSSLEWYVHFRFIVKLKKIPGNIHLPMNDNKILLLLIFYHLPNFIEHFISVLTKFHSQWQTHIVYMFYRFRGRKLNLVSPIIKDYEYSTPSLRNLLMYKLDQKKCEWVGRDKTAIHFFKRAILSKNKSLCKERKNDTSLYAMKTYSFKKNMEKTKQIKKPLRFHVSYH